MEQEERKKLIQAIIQELSKDDHLLVELIESYRKNDSDGIFTPLYDNLERGFLREKEHMKQLENDLNKVSDKTLLSIKSKIFEK